MTPDYLKCEVCGRDIAWRVEQWSLFWRRIWRRVVSPLGDGYAYALDAFTVCSRAACRPYAHFWSAS